MLLQFCALGVTTSWDDGFLGARASRPHQAWHGLGHLPHLDQPGTAPWLSFGLAAAVPACLPARQADSVAAQHRTEAQRRPKGQDAGGTPALPGDAVPAVPWGCLAGDFSESRRAPFGKLPFAREPGPRPGGWIIRGCNNRSLWPIGSRDQVPLNRLAVSGNMDRQDGQDKQDQTLLHRKRTPSMIGCAFEEIHELGSGFLESLLKTRGWSNSRG